MLLALVGYDPSLRNWGVSKGIYDTDSGRLVLNHLQVLCPVITKNKQVRQNSMDLESAQQLNTAAASIAQGAGAVFVEVPHGSQSARAMASYGICVGVLGSLRAQGIPFFEVTAKEVKLASVGTEQATKGEMINWAMKKHPEAPWPKVKQKGVVTVSAAQAEHMADATAAIYAGLAGQPFQQMLSMLRTAQPQRSTG